MDDNSLAALCEGLDVHKAKMRLLAMYPEISESDLEIYYEESTAKRFTVTKCTYDRRTKKIILIAASLNPIRHLPANYQENDFLRSFLMVFQHVFNNTALTLDNINTIFMPMETPTHFLSLLADWFGINLNTLGSEEEIRKFLQYAIPLYRYRGTAIGLRAHLAIVSGVTPEIIPDVIPYSALFIDDTSVVDIGLYDVKSNETYFTVHFPVERITFDDQLINRMSLIIQQEKPVHTVCFLSFNKPMEVKRNVTTIYDNTTMDFENGIIF